MCNCLRRFTGISFLVPTARGTTVFHTFWALQGEFSPVGYFTNSLFLAASKAAYENEIITKRERALNPTFPP